jgi:UTP--glucose-1-phosphate uridylyltransferase
MINKCLFPAAGYGTRFLPATKAIPKEMLPILNKPLLQYGVEEALSAGVTNMAIVTGRGKRSIEDHFDNAFELETQLKGTLKEHYLNEINIIIKKSTFTYVRQQEMLGLGHAILTGEPLIGNVPFAVILADDLCVSHNYKNNVLTQMIKAYERYHCSIVAFQEVDPSETEKYGIISGELINGTDDLYQVNRMVEKPSPNESPGNMAIIGRYILSPEIFESLRKIKPDSNNEIQITDALNLLAHEGKVIAYKIQAERFDCGTIEGYLLANNYLAKKSGIL